MRSDEEILELIVSTAKHDDRIRAVIMSGSRTNPHAVRDIFQDFDIVYLVTEVDSFQEDHTWIRRFGERMILQMPESMQDPPPSGNGGLIYLMQFMDGSRIDLSLIPIGKHGEPGHDSLSLLLLDKDDRLEPFPPPSDRDYLPLPPTAKLFSDCCNEFWWVCPNIAKGLWREEIVYAKAMFDQVTREQLMKMLTWHVGVQTRFTRSPGKFGKYLKQYLEPERWEMLQKTYADAGYENTWDALDTMCELFRMTALLVAEHFGFEYPQGDDKNVSTHLQYVRSLPKDAKEMYSQAGPPSGTAGGE